MTALTASHLTKVIGARTIVDDVSFDLAPGEVFGFLGPNGAGKTTTLRMLLDIVHPTAGHAEILGADPRRAPCVRRGRRRNLPPTRHRRLDAAAS